jgi:membrane-associated phospholipid phosphatase
MKTLKNLYFKASDFVHRHKEGIPFLIYLIIYLTWFSILEDHVVVPKYLIHLEADNHIPFVPAFIIPYELWFGYVLGTILFLLFTAKEEYKRLFIFLTTGMTLFLIISTLWPNGQDLRPNLIGSEGFFENWVAHLYRTDTPTNIWPSIHVYNSLGVEFAVARSEKLRKHKGIRIASFILCILIILSTMFLKQHSVFDVGTAIILAVGMYYLIYYLDILQMIKTAREKKQVQ